MNIIITGASAGLGRGLATWFAERGHTVGWVGRDRPNLIGAIRQLDVDEEQRARMHFAVIDLSDPVQTESGLIELADRMGGVDVLVNNAAMVDTRPLPEFTPSEIDELARTNLGGTAIAIRVLLDALRDSKRGHVVNISSINGNLDPLRRASLYNASKFALKGFGYALAEELRAFGLRVTTLSPGAIDSRSKRHTSDRDHSWKLPVSAVAEAIEYVVNVPDSVDVTELELKPTQSPR